MWPEQRRWQMSLIAVITMVLFSIMIWLGREQIAGNLIDDALESNGLEATYRIVSIGPQQQVIADLVIGDPDAPDLTAERVNVDIEYSFGAPEIGRIELIRPRLYGTFRDGRLSLGALDPLIYTESDEPPGLPEIDLAIVDGRARIDSEYGAIGAKFDGAGRLDGGFSGTLAATAPGFGIEGCRADVATIYGALSVESGQPGFDGPVRLRGLECEGSRLESVDIAARLTLSDDLASFDGDLGIQAAGIAYEGNRLAELAGGIDVLWRFVGDETELSLRHNLTGSRLATEFGEIGQVVADGTLRASDGFARSEWSTAITGRGIDLDLANNSTLAEARSASEGTLVGPLLAKLQRGLSRALTDGRMMADLTVRTGDEGVRLIVPDARLRSGAGDTVLALSRVSYASRGERLTGNVLTGGANLPRINGRMEQEGGGDLVLRLGMAEYSDGRDSIAIPRMLLRQSSGGRVSFNGLVLASGALPGGEVRGLRLPLEGSWSSGTGLSVGENCAEVRMDGLRLSQLSLEARRLRLCPATGQAMVRYDETLKVVVQSSELELSGQLGDTPARVNAGRLVLQYPGPFSAEDVEAIIGQRDNAVRLTASTLEGAFSDEIGGTFRGGTAALDAVPLDLSEISGSWAYVDDTLRIAEGSFELTERTGPALAPEARFEPMQARGATLAMMDNVIQATAPVRRFEDGQLVTMVTVRHDLTSGQGRADLDVPGLRFTESLQPDDLTYLADGVVQLVRGTVEGEGRITWDGSDVESSGTFRTNDLDLAAAFGPVKGLSGEIVFTDLLGLSTAPGQVLQIGAVNPGVEVLGGQVVYVLEGGTLIKVEQGRWPFMGGELILRPVDIAFDSDGEQAYVFEIIGLDAAAFVAQMEIDNIDASGIFDGTIPIVFDADGNGQIRGGLLISRPPGGNVAYLGELTYEDMGAIANFAFQSLRSLDYRQMSVELEGSVSGEILTRFVIDGVSQGEGASENFVTKRISKLPIRFNINVRSENFSQLALVARGINDPTAFGDAVDQGIFMFEDGELVRRREPVPIPEPDPQAIEAQRRDETPVQPPESD